jgi:hypothetical protein
MDLIVISNKIFYIMLLLECSTGHLRLAGENMDSHPHGSGAKHDRPNSS